MKKEKYCKQMCILCCDFRRVFRKIIRHCRETCAKEKKILRQKQQNKKKQKQQTKKQRNNAKKQRNKTKKKHDRKSWEYSSATVSAITKQPTTRHSASAKGSELTRSRRSTKCSGLSPKISLRLTPGYTNQILLFFKTKLSSNQILLFFKTKLSSRLPGSQS